MKPIGVFCPSPGSWNESILASVKVAVMKKNSKPGLEGILKLRENIEKQGLCTTSTFMKRSIAMPGSLRIGKIAGIDIDINVSWIIIANEHLTKHHLFH